MECPIRISSWRAPCLSKKLGVIGLLLSFGNRQEYLKIAFERLGGTEEGSISRRDLLVSRARHTHQISRSPPRICIPRVAPMVLNIPWSSKHATLSFRSMLIQPYCRLNQPCDLPCPHPSTITPDRATDETWRDCALCACCDFGDGSEQLAFGEDEESEALPLANGVDDSHEDGRRHEDTDGLGDSISLRQVWFSSRDVVHPFTHAPILPSIHSANCLFQLSPSAGMRWKAKR